MIRSLVTRRALICTLFAAGLVAVWIAVAVLRNTLVPPGYSPYAPGAAPDRIVLVLTADPAQSQTVNWRTAPGVTAATAQITEARDSPGLHVGARTVRGVTRAHTAENGLAHHHSVRFDGLVPDTLYAYRVRGLDTWSEWLHFRTAKAQFAPFSFLYFGDAQNSIKSHFSRVIRQAWRELPGVALMLHAGDLVSQREGRYDDEWGEWFAAGGFLHAMAPSMPVTGNHEYLELENDRGEEVHSLGPLWSAQFSLPANGPPGLTDTVYYVEYQDVLFVALDSLRALDDEGAATAQARWLEQLLRDSRHRWRIVSQHHPMYSVAIGRDNAELRRHWQPLYDRYGVDLVLQGHDHSYGRGANVTEGARATSDEVGPVYVVSVAGPKMYLVAEQSRGFTRVGEDAQLYQTVHVEERRLRFESRTATGTLYDAFDIERLADGRKRIVERLPAGSAETVCTNANRPQPTRCWDGTELVD